MDYKHVQRSNAKTLKKRVYHFRKVYGDPVDIDCFLSKEEFDEYIKQSIETKEEYLRSVGITVK